MVTVTKVGVFPEILTYYMEQECEACFAKNYVTLAPGVGRCACWNCKFSWGLPTEIDLPRPEHEPVLN